MWQTDGLTEAAWHAATAATNASRFAEDLELYGSDEFGLLRIGDELCRASALMPQKRNPYALVVIRGGGGHAARPRDAACWPRSARRPGRTDNLLYAYGEVARRGGARHAHARPRGGDRGEPDDRPRRPARGPSRESFALAADVAELLSLRLGPRLPLGLPRRRPRGGDGEISARRSTPPRASCSAS